MARYRTYTPTDETPLMDGDSQFVGVNMRLSAEKLQPGFLATGSQNLRFRTGGAATRLGLTKPGWLNVTDPVNFPNKIMPVGEFYGVGNFKDPNSIEYVLIAADGIVYRHIPGNRRVAMTLPSGVMILSRCSFAQAFGIVFCFRGRYLAPLMCADVGEGFTDILPQWSASSTYNAPVTLLSTLPDEMAYGPFQTIASMTYTPTTVTVVTSQPHGYVTGADVTIKDTSPPKFDGRWNITVLDELTFTFAVNQPASGTATATPINITALSWASGTVSATTSGVHGFGVGQRVTIAGCVPTGFNGSYTILSTTSTTFTYAETATLGASTVLGSAAVPMMVSNMANYWAALGSQVVPTSLTWASNVATVTTPRPHGFSTNQYVTIAGVAPAAYNGTWQINVTSTTTFTYALPTNPGSSAATVGTATSSVVLAGQNPDTNPEAWQQVFNVLPNADDAVYCNNRLMVPTAYTPDALGYNSTAVSYTKKDYLVATDIQDYIHFDFVNNEFRINEGNDDEINSVVVYNQTTLMIFKGKSWGILTGIGTDLSQVSLNMFGASYGSCALRAAVTAGEDVLFPSTKRGICSCYMTQLGQVRGTDTPFSNELQAIIDRVNWSYASGIRMAWWNDALYCAFPLDSAKLYGPNLVPQAAVYAATTGPFTVYTCNIPVTPGATYLITPGSSADLGVFEPGFVPPFSAYSQLTGEDFNGPITYVAENDYITLQGNAAFAGIDGAPVTVTVQQVLNGVNNTLAVYDYRMGYSGSPLTYDFRGGQWAGPDVGPFCVLEFFKANVNGLERLFFIGADGFVSMLEESTSGDQVYSPNSPSGLMDQPINSIAVSRGYTMKDQKEPEGQKRFGRVEIVVATMNPTLTITANTGAGFSVINLVSNLTFDQVSYYQPFDAPPYDPTNVNQDFQTPGRYDYTVFLGAGGLYVGGLNLGTFQELTKRVSLRPLIGRYGQFTVQSTTGRMKLKSISPEAITGARRSGVLI